MASAIPDGAMRRAQFLMLAARDLFDVGCPQTF
jgi:hypothetical protein